MRLNLYFLRLVHARNINDAPVKVIPVSVEQVGGGSKAPATELEEANNLLRRTLTYCNPGGFIIWNGALL